jgi:TolB-like protein
MKTKSAAALILTRTLISRAACFGFLFGLATAASPGTLAASFELVSRESTGYGESEDTALVSALVEAVRQLRGLSIESEKSLRTSLVETESKRSLEVELDDQVRSRSKGLIHSYDVLALTQQDQRWLAKLLVTMPQYRSPGLDRSNLRSIAVLPFRVKARSGAELGRPWEQKLVTHIVQARRFRVLDREFNAELDREEARLRSGDAPLTELVRIGQQLGADYVIVGEITHFDLKPEGGADLLDEASLVVEYRVIEPATREVRWANTANASHSRDSLQRLGLRGSPRQVQEYLLNTSADTVVSEIFDLIYPIKVVRLEPDGTILLTQGGSRVQTGQWFGIHATGESTDDPDTGLPVRPDGPEVALASVVKVQEKWSWAKIEQGAREAIKERMICRRLSGERIVAMQRQAQQDQMRKQDELIKAGKCPALVVRTFRTAIGWNLVVKNSSGKALQISALTKRIAGASEQTPMSLAVRSGAEEAFGLPYAFAAGDALELTCDGFEQPYTFFFP